MRPTASDGVVAFTGIIGTVCGDATDRLARRDLVEQIGRHRRITDVAPGDLDSANLKRLLIDPEVDLAPDAPFRASMLAGVPFALNFELDPGAVRCLTVHHEVMSLKGDEQVQRQSPHFNGVLR